MNTQHVTYTYNGYLSSIKGDEALMYATMWMKLENIVFK